MNEIPLISGDSHLLRGAYVGLLSDPTRVSVIFPTSHGGSKNSTTCLYLQQSPRPSRKVHDHPNHPHFQLKHLRPPSEPCVVPHRKCRRSLRVLHPVAPPREGMAVAS